MSDMLPGVERAIMKLAELMPRLLHELEKLNKNFEQNRKEKFTEAKEQHNQAAEIRQFNLEHQEPDFAEQPKVDIQKVVQAIKDNGPNRVVVDEEGTAVPPNPKVSAGIDLVFIRNDGWSLGASRNLARVAEDMWSDAWVAVLAKGTKQAIPYSVYRQGRFESEDQ